MSKRILFLFLFILLLFGCKKNPTSSGDNITVTWKSNYTCTYNYSSSGFLQGQTCFIGFTVTSGSGNLIIEAEVTKGEGNSKTINTEVNEGENYSLRVPIGLSGTQNCTPGSAPGKITITAGKSDPQYINITCDFNGTAPKKLTIGDLSI